MICLSLEGNLKGMQTCPSGKPVLEGRPGRNKIVLADGEVFLDTQTIKEGWSESTELLAGCSNFQGGPSTVCPPMVVGRSSKWTHRGKGFVKKRTKQTKKSKNKVQHKVINTANNMWWFVSPKPL
mmetsp:Transcript_151369/g.264445  ORF Transcript_151369/g.264445 Transcript_151369/m.264445 type:complete len:125 (-) Transcript_151369:145-519(-)